MEAAAVSQPGIGNPLLREGQLLLLDCRTRKTELVPMSDPSVELLVINTNVKHELSGGEYAERRAQCEEAAAKLGVKSLRDVTAEQLEKGKGKLSEVVYRRARHVIGEIERTTHAAEGIRQSNWPTVGQFMYASHYALRDDYEVSCAELDAVVEIAEGIGYSLDVTIDDYVLIDMAGFVKVIDALGGVTVNVRKAVPTPGNPPGSLHTVPPVIEAGVQYMDGTTALAYVRSRKAEEELTAAQRDLAQARARAGQNDEERRRQLEEAEARAHAVTEQWDGARRALRAATAAVRRAAFLPPAVRVSMQEAVGPDEGEGRAAPWMGVVLLDRDAVTLEAVASALEASSVDVRIAGHPEEVALLLRTADAATLGAVVCDVMAFRSDQNVAGLIRTWDRDRPGLAYFLSFDPDNAAEAERARRIPTSLIAGHVRRPLAPPRLVETLETLAKRRGKL